MQFNNEQTKSTNKPNKFLQSIIISASDYSLFIKKMYYFYFQVIVKLWRKNIAFVTSVISINSFFFPAWLCFILFTFWYFREVLADNLCGKEIAVGELLSNKNFWAILKFPI